MDCSLPTPDFEDIKEYHFHIYFVQTNKEATKEAEEFRAKLTAAIESGRLAARCNPINYGPRGPHVIGNMGAWVPAEAFQKTYNFYMLNRGSMNVLIHPLTKSEITDHTKRAVWMGSPLPLDTTYLVNKSDDVTPEHPEMKMGYSAAQQ